MDKRADILWGRIIGWVILLVLLVWVLIWYISLRKTGASLLGGLFS